MQRLLEQKEDVIIFDLNEIFTDQTVQMDEINSDDIPDEVLNQIIQDSEEITTEQAKTVLDLPEVERICNTKEIPNKNRFKFVCNDDVDKIASKSCTKKTDKQTMWGVKIFRGTEIT